MNNIIITRLQNIGDMLVFIPALRRLKQLVPDAHITLLGKHQQGLEIIRHCPYVDEILEIRNRKLIEKLRLFREFRRRQPDIFIVSPQDQGKVPWAVCGGAKKIAAFKSVFIRDRLKKEKLTFFIDVAPDFDKNLSETENSVMLIEAALRYCGIEVPDTSRQKRFALQYDWFRPDTPGCVKQVLAARGIEHNCPLVASAMFSKMSDKNWPTERFMSLYKFLNKRFAAKVVLIGGAGDQEKGNAAAAEMPQMVFNLAGELSLDQSAWLLKKSDIFVGNDSGPAHLASAVGTPVVTLYRRENYARWKHPADISPRIELVAENNDLREITLETVADACSCILKERNGQCSRELHEAAMI